MKSMSVKQSFVILVVFFSFLFFYQQALAVNFYVNSVGTGSDANPGDGTCETAPGNGICTLHAAIQEANDQSISVILFNGQYTINACGLPPLTGGKITINGYDQWDTGSDLPGVTLQFLATSCGSTPDIITINSSENHVYGLSLIGSSAGVTGIKINEGSDNAIGADVAGHRNVFVVGEYGVENESSGSNNTISSNYFGTYNGTTLPGISGINGIRNISSGNTINNNVIVGQSSAGIHLSGSTNTIDNNIIGLNKYETNDLPNNIGIYHEYGVDNNITNNTIGGNSTYGIWLGVGSDNTKIETNIIGTPLNINFLGNLDHGIYVTSGGVHTIRNNDIDVNEGSGIFIYGSGILTIQGNSIIGNKLHGVHFALTASGTIGGGSYTNGYFSNEIYKNSQHGIYLEGSSSVIISGNHIGQGYSPTGSYNGNLQCGIMLDSGASGNIIGGNNAEDANWIGWNQQDGISISGATTMNNYVKNNIIGAPYLFYWPTPNKFQGISLLFGAHDNIIGGAGVGNTILASGANGIYIGFSSDNNSVLENMIGSDGTHNWGNNYNGISIWEVADTIIYRNKIAFNSPSSTSGGGIKIQGATAIHNRISENSIHDNGGFGIDLSSGANGSIASPVITRQGKAVTGISCPGCTVEIFTDTQNQGQYFEGSVVADGAGNFSWSGSFQGSFITATSTDSALNTSMFSSSIKAPFPWPMFLPAIINKVQ